MASPEETASRELNCDMEDAMLRRYLERRPELDTRAKQLAFAKAELAAHVAAADRWVASYRGRTEHKIQYNRHGHLRWTNRSDWRMREAAWLRLIFALEHGE